MSPETRLHGRDLQTGIFSDEVALGPFSLSSGELVRQVSILTGHHGRGEKTAELHELREMRLVALSAQGTQQPALSLPDDFPAGQSVFYGYGLEEFPRLRDEGITELKLGQSRFVVSQGALSPSLSMHE